MAIKRYKPTSSARRFMTVSAYDEITKNCKQQKKEDWQNKCKFHCRLSFFALNFFLKFHGNITHLSLFMKMGRDKPVPFRLV